MCGRFSLATSKTAVETTFKGVEVPEELPLRYNIAPSQQAFVISNEAPHALHKMYWGLVPHWDKDGKWAGQLINARMETIFEKPSFRESILKRRCLVLMDSFYEWRNIGGHKKPYRILLKKGGLMAAAGIWDRWGSGSQAFESFSVITTPANREISNIHDRMPLFLLTPTDQEKWLSPIAPEEVHLMLQPVADGTLDLYSVSEKVNKVNNDSPELHDVAPEQLSFF